MAGNAPGTEPSVIALVRDAVRDFSVIVKGEIALASAELKRQAAAGAAGGMLLAIVVSLLSVAGLFASFALAYGLNAAGIWLWASFLIVAGLYLLFSIILVFIAVIAFRKIKGPQNASRIAAQTKAYLQAALAPVKEDDADGAEGTDGEAPKPVPVDPSGPTAPVRNVTLPARVPSAQATPPTASPAPGSEGKPKA